MIQLDPKGRGYIVDGVVVVSTRVEAEAILHAALAPDAIPVDAITRAAMVPPPRHRLCTTPTQAPPGEAPFCGRGDRDQGEWE